MEENKFTYISDEIHNEFEKILDRIKSKWDIEYNKIDFEFNYNKKVYYVVDQRFINLKQINVIEKIKNRLLNDNNFNLLIYSAHESLDKSNLIFLKNLFNEYKFDEKKIYLVNNGSNLNELQIKYDTNFNIYRLNILSNNKIGDMIYSTDSFFKKNKSGKFFMTFNKEDKTHRYGLLMLLKKNNLLEQTNWSFLRTNKGIINSDRLKKIMSEDLVITLSNEIEYFKNLEYKFSDYESQSEFNRNVVIELTMGENIKNYENSYVNLTTESIFDEREELIHITEKSYKPFYYYQFPLIMASENHIKKMKELYDLDFYEDVIDYSYDGVDNDEERFKLYFKEILRINDNKEKFIEFYNNNQHRFEQNKQKVIKIMDLLYNDYQYFTNLI
jgi:hypothetical protein